MYLLAVHNADPDGPGSHVMAIGPFSSAERADAYLEVAGLCDHDDFLDYEIIVVNPPDKTLLTLAAFEEN